MRKLRVIVGFSVWVVALALLGFGARDFFFSEQTHGRDVATELWQFGSAKRMIISLDVANHIPIQVGDPIYQIGADHTVEQIGEIRQVHIDPNDAVAQNDASHDKTVQTKANQTVALALLYPSASAPTNRSRFIYYSTSDSLSWVIETMLPPQKRQQITREISATYAANRFEILQALKPIVVSSLTDALRVIEQDLATAVTRHRKELEQLGGRYQEQVVQQEILPLVRREIWPIVRRHAEPLANQIGEAMWQQASLWRFGWRYLYDTLPLSEKHLTRDEWKRFVDEEGVPILNRYSDDIVAAQRHILSEMAKNPEIRDAVHRHLAQIIDDPEFRAIVWTIIREALIDNRRLQKALEDHWRGDEARRAVQLAAAYVEPCARRIGDLLLGSREEGISPEFAQVLRNQILGKDRRWLVLETPANAIPYKTLTRSTRFPVVRGSRPEMNPFAVQLQSYQR